MDCLAVLAAQTEDAGFHAQHFRVIWICGQGTGKLPVGFVDPPVIKRLSGNHYMLNGLRP